MKELPEAEGVQSQSPRQRRQMRELLSTLLDSSGNQREYLISVLLSQMEHEEGEEPSLKTMRSLSASILEQLIFLLRGNPGFDESSLLEFCRYLNLFPLDPETHLNSALQNIFGLEEDIGDEHFKLFRRYELLYMLTRMGDFDTARTYLTELAPDVSLDYPRRYIIYQLSLARIYQNKGRRLQFTALWLNLISDVLQLDGSETALYFILRWIGMLNWGRDSAVKKTLLQKFGTYYKHSGNLISATLLYELFSLENRLVSPAEKMHCARLLFRHQSSLLTVQQMQYLHFFAGNYYSGMKFKFPESIRSFQNSNYFLHKSWEYLKRLSQFMREQQPCEQYVRTMVFLEQWVTELGSQVSVQNNAYVETLHANFEEIKDLYKQVEDLSVTDKLTGLKNRRYLGDNLFHMFQLAARHKVNICFAMMDIDLFKSINDDYGHLAGDQILKGISKLLISSFRKSDVIVRFGGEEFLLIFFDITCERFLLMMDDLRKKIAAHRFKTTENQISLTVSIGLNCSSEPCLDEEQMNAQIEKADAALLLAKRSGRNQVLACPEEFPA
jgi:diguanylate cyclase (GGDEF)-like protein